MGKGIDLAKGLDLETGGTGIHSELLDNFKDQLLIVFLKELQAEGHPLTFPVAMVDDTSQDMVSFKVDKGTFIFSLGKKA